MKIIRAKIFEQFPESIFGFSTKEGMNRGAPYYFNLSNSVGDIPEIVSENRNAFYEALGLVEKNIALQRQVHGKNITFVQSGGIYQESDALITDMKEIGLAVSSADCTPIFLYCRDKQIISAIHSGWRSTEKKITEYCVNTLINEFGCSPDFMYVYIAPSISQKNYEVGEEVASKFDKEFLSYNDNKIYLNVAGMNYKMLLGCGIPPNNIERSELCSFEEKELLHSYRRDGLKSGRALGIIALKNLKG